MLSLGCEHGKIKRRLDLYVVRHSSTGFLDKTSSVVGAIAERMEKVSQGCPIYFFTFLRPVDLACGPHFAGCTRGGGAHDADRSCASPDRCGSALRRRSTSASSGAPGVWASRGYLSTLSLFCPSTGACLACHITLLHPKRVARLEYSIEQRNLDTLLRALRRLRDDGMNVELHIYGDGPDKDTLAE